MNRRRTAFDRFLESQMEKPGFAEGYEMARAEIAEADVAARAATVVESKSRVMYASKVDFRTGEHWIREVVVAGEPAEVA